MITGLKSKILRIFVYVLLAVFALLLITAGMLNTVYFYFSKPDNRGYNWLEGYSEDYVGYVSYIKEGMYGRNYIVVRSMPKKDQKPTTILWPYLFIGKLGTLLGVTAPIAYHLFRILFGLFLIISTFWLLYLLLGDILKALLTTILSFFTAPISWYRLVDGQWVYASSVKIYNFSYDLTIRALSRPHYEFGAVLFLIISILLLTKNRPSLVRFISLCQLAILLGTVHVPFALMLWIIVFIFFIKKMISKAEFKKMASFLIVVLGLTAGIVSSLIGTQQFQWQIVYNYQSMMSFDLIINLLIWFGPTLWFGFIGLIYITIKNRAKSDKQLFIFIWFITQYSLFFFLSPLLRVENVRFIQSLFFIPIAYGTAVFFQVISRSFHSKIWYIGMGLMILIGLPVYIHDLNSKLSPAIAADETSYSAFIFPSKNMLASYEFLDRYTPKESTILARFEAANNILIYSHNFVVGSRLNLTPELASIMERKRDEFLFGQMNEEVMRKYLKDNSIEYIYAGYQERLSDLFNRFPRIFLPIYKNDEVLIYSVKL